MRCGLIIELAVCLCIRPSGTEDVVRVYAEADTQVSLALLIITLSYINILSVLRRFQRGHPACDKTQMPVIATSPYLQVSDEVLVWLSVWTNVQIVCIWSS